MPLTLPFTPTQTLTRCWWRASNPTLHPNPSPEQVLMACRFVLGVGVGGKYPLAATIRAEARSLLRAVTYEAG